MLIKNIFTGDSIGELETILIDHKKWLNSEKGGKRANLQSADLRSANLRSADLRSANLRSANLQSADLQSANLRSADLRSANLRSANLRSADLYNAKYNDTETLIKYFTIGPIGSRNDYLQVFQTDVTTYIKTGCFTGNINKFDHAVTNQHADNRHATAYRAAIVLITILTTQEA
jgi:uncharacterized protein YjbI with pentapeptide repeats